MQYNSANTMHTNIKKLSYRRENGALTEYFVVARLLNVSFIKSNAHKHANVHTYASSPATPSECPPETRVSDVNCSADGIRIYAYLYPFTQRQSLSQTAEARGSEGSMTPPPPPPPAFNQCMFDPTFSCTNRWLVHFFMEAVSENCGGFE